MSIGLAALLAGCLAGATPAARAMASPSPLAAASPPDGSAPGATAPAPAAKPAAHGPGRLVVTFRRGTVAADQAGAHARAGTRLARRLPRLGAAVVDATDEAAALAAYRALPDVVSAEPDITFHATAVPVDSWYDPTPDDSGMWQWNLHPAGPDNPAATSWQDVYGTGPMGDGVTVAVVDSGFEATGTDGVAHLAAGVSFVPNEGTDDRCGHGTHVSGTIAQTTGNTIPGPNFAGVAPGATILPVKVLTATSSGDCTGSLSAVLSGIDYAVGKASVINLSLGGSSYSRALCDAVTAASRSAIVVAATGNESTVGGMMPVSYPGACPGALAVGGLRFDASRGSYSNGGCEVAVAGPGGDSTDEGRLYADPYPAPNDGRDDPRNVILQEFHGGALAESGTSMSAAHVSGEAAILLSRGASRDATVRAVRSGVRDVGAPGPDNTSGTGAADLPLALQAVSSGAVPRDSVGYWLVASDGGLFAFGDAPFLGSTGDIRLNSPIVGMARTPSGRGYWMVAADGGIFAFGDAGFYGSAAGEALGAPVVGMVPTPSGQGYWLVTSRGRVRSYGDAVWWGDASGMSLKAPIVGMATVRSRDDAGQDGYWLVGADGGIFAYGSAAFYGSTGNLRLNAPIVGLTPTPSSDGYWMLASDGGIFAFGDAPFFGSTGDIRLNRPVVGMTSTCYGTGYWLVASDGGIFAFGNAPFLGSTGDIRLNRPVVGMLVAADHRATQG